MTARGAVDDEHRSVGNELRALYQGQGIGPDGCYRLLPHRRAITAEQVEAVASACA
jgi:hypothetical protein